MKIKMSLNVLDYTANCVITLPIVLHMKNTSLFKHMKSVSLLKHIKKIYFSCIFHV